MIAPTGLYVDGMFVGDAGGETPYKKEKPQIMRLYKIPSTKPFHRFKGECEQGALFLKSHTVMPLFVKVLQKGE
jgi:hypothetical protein